MTATAPPRGRTRPVPVRSAPQLRIPWPAVFLVVMAVALFALPPVFGRSTSTFSIYNSLQSFSGFGLVALALGLTMIVGEFDLSVVGTFALGGMLAVKLGVDSPLLGAVAAILVCALVGLVQGLVVARLGVNSMAVTLGGYLLTLGITGTIGHNKSQSYANFSLSGRLNEPVAQVLSLRSLVAVAVFAVVVAVLLGSRAGRDMRATGGGRRASRTAGVRVDALLCCTFAASGALAALGGVLQSYGLATATSDPGLTPLIFGVTASLLGGVALSGGRGSALGIAAGALGLCFLQELFTALATPQYVVSLLTGGLLVAVTVVATPVLARWWHGLTSRRAAALPALPSATPGGSR